MAQGPFTAREAVLSGPQYNFNVIQFHMKYDMFCEAILEITFAIQLSYIVRGPSEGRVCCKGGRLQYRPKVQGEILVCVHSMALGGLYKI